jgi:mono/diheme cytochrome c family protein
MPLCLAACLGVATLFAVSAGRAEEPKKEEPAAAAAPAAPPAEESAADAAARKSKEALAAVAARKITEVTGKPPLEILKDNPLGTMRNPFTDDATKIEEGKKLYFSYSCNGCHGGGGGGGMCPPLTNDTWVYGSDDDILYRLITQGTQDLKKEYNLNRKGQEGVVGPMPPFGELIKSDEEVWKVIAFIRSTYKGSKRNW